MQTWNAVSFEWDTGINFFIVRQQDIADYWNFPSKTSRNFVKRLVQKNVWHDWRETLVKKSLQHQLFSFAVFVGKTLFSDFFCNHHSTVVQSLFFYTFRSGLERFFATNINCIFWRSKFQKLGTPAFCSWDDIFIQEWSCSSPNKFRRFLHAVNQYIKRLKANTL